MALAIPATTLELLGVLQAKTAMAVAPAAKVNMQESISSRNFPFTLAHARGTCPCTYDISSVN